MIHSDDCSGVFEPNGDEGHDARLEDEFPLGDGTAETEATVSCPYCGETVTIALDPGGGSIQDYVEDCQVCCQPWALSVSYHQGHADVSVRPLDE